MTYRSTAPKVVRRWNTRGEPYEVDVYPDGTAGNIRWLPNSDEHAIVVTRYQNDYVALVRALNERREAEARLRKTRVHVVLVALGFAAWTFVWWLLLR